MSAIVTAEYKTFFKELKERIHKAQYDALNPTFAIRGVGEPLIQ